MQVSNRFGNSAYKMTTIFSESISYILVHLSEISFSQGANPTILSYIRSNVKLYNATTSSLGRFENRNIFFCFEKTL
jgi:hypothetical protein